METERTQAKKLSRAEILSAIADDEALDSLDHLLADLDQGDQARWFEYHLIGDALRAIDLAAPEASTDAFLTRFSIRLAEERPLCPPVSGYKRFFQWLAGLRRFLLPTAMLSAIPVVLAWMMVVQLHGMDTAFNTPQIAPLDSQRDAQHRLLALSPLSTRAAHDENKVGCSEFVSYFEAHQEFSPQPVMGRALTYIRTTAHL